MDNTLLQLLDESCRIAEVADTNVELSHQDMRMLLNELHRYRSALERISYFAKTNPNAPFVRAMKQPLIDIAEDALGITPQFPVDYDEPVSGLG